MTFVDLVRDTIEAQRPSTDSSLYYTSDEVRVDTDSQLMAKNFQLMARSLGIIWTPTYFQKPQAHGMERSNGSLKALFKACCLEDPDTKDAWINFMPLLNMVNSRLSAETGYSAKLMTFGDVSRLAYALPVDLAEEEIPDAAIRALTRRIEFVRKKGHEHLLKAQARR